jgi:hypothetical protein
MSSSPMPISSAPFKQPAIKIVQTIFLLLSELLPPTQLILLEMICQRPPDHPHGVFRAGNKY